MTPNSSVSKVSENATAGNPSFFDGLARTIVIVTFIGAIVGCKPGQPKQQYTEADLQRVEEMLKSYDVNENTLALDTLLTIAQDSKTLREAAWSRLTEVARDDDDRVVQKHGVDMLFGEYGWNGYADTEPNVVAVKFLVSIPPAEAAPLVKIWIGNYPKPAQGLAYRPGPDQLQINSLQVDSWVIYVISKLGPHAKPFYPIIIKQLNDQLAYKINVVGDHLYTREAIEVGLTAIERLGSSCATEESANMVMAVLLDDIRFQRFFRRQNDGVLEYGGYPAICREKVHCLRCLGRMGAAARPCVPTLIQIAQDVNLRQDDGEAIRIAAADAIKAIEATTDLAPLTRPE